MQEINTFFLNDTISTFYFLDFMSFGSLKKRIAYV